LIAISVAGFFSISALIVLKPGETPATWPLSSFVSAPEAIEDSHAFAYRFANAVSPETETFSDSTLQRESQRSSPLRSHRQDRPTDSTSAIDTVGEQLRGLHPTDRVLVVAAFLREAAQQNSDKAVWEAIRFCDEDPSYSLEYGRSLISTLASTGDYRAALRFVLAEEAEGWLGENGIKWLNFLFNDWAAVAPRQAIQSVELMVGPGLRGEALQTIAASWGKSDPLVLANYVWQLPASPDRDLMMAATLRTWADTDPESADAWMKSQNK
jgi:hypothetical protein